VDSFDSSSGYSPDDQQQFLNQTEIGLEEGPEMRHSEEGECTSLFILMQLAGCCEQRWRNHVGNTIAA
jgi:hypothetical protein